MSAGVRPNSQLYYAPSLYEWAAHNPTVPHSRRAITDDEMADLRRRARESMYNRMRHSARRLHAGIRSTVAAAMVEADDRRNNRGVYASDLY